MADDAPPDADPSTLPEYADRLDGLTDTATQTANIIFDRAKDEKLLQGRRPERVIAAALYAGARSEGLLVQPQDISEVMDVDEKHILANFKLLQRELELGIEPVTPQMYIEEYAEALELPDNVKDLALEIVDVCRENDMSVGSPTGFAAGALYAASSLLDAEVTQKELADHAGKTTVTVRSWYKKQLEAYKNATADDD